MADGEYKRLTCTVGACDKGHKAKGLCVNHYRQVQRGGLNEYKPQACAHCGQSYTPEQRGTMYCGKRCKMAAWKAANQERWAELNGRYAPLARKVSAYHAAYCSECGAAFGTRHKREHCNDLCRQRANYVSIAAPTRECANCAIIFDTPPFVTRPTDFCSETCSEQAKRRNQRVGKLKRAARLRGVHSEAVDPFKVFDRDQWRCKLCGVKTPKAKRGTYDDDAPELDHIIPLSRGGPHSYLNTQCACRRCNGAKSDKPLGQLLLVG